MAVYTSSPSGISITGAGQANVNLPTITQSISVAVNSSSITSATITTGSGNDAITGSIGNDSINTGGGNDTLVGGRGIDTLFGDAAGDLFIITSASDYSPGEVISGGGIIPFANGITFVSNIDGDTLILNATTSDISSISMGSNLDGSSTSAQLNINASLVPNSLGIFANSNANILIGTAFGEVIRGNRGNDTLTGNGGADSFDYLSPNDGVDVITDFFNDNFSISAPGFGGGLVGANPSTPIIANQFESGPGLVAAILNLTTRFVYNTTNGALYFDIDGNLNGIAPVPFATLLGAPLLAFNNIQLGSL